MPIDPVPIVITVSVVHTDSHSHLGLSPQSRPVGWGQTHIRAKVGQLQFAIGTVKNNFGLVIAVGSVIGRQLKTNALGRGHAIFAGIFRPVSAGIHAVGVALIISLIIGRRSI